MPRKGITRVFLIRMKRPPQTENGNLKTKPTKHLHHTPALKLCFCCYRHLSRNLKTEWKRETIILWHLFHFFFFFKCTMKMPGTLAFHLLFHNRNHVSAAWSIILAWLLPLKLIKVSCESLWNRGWRPVYHADISLTLNDTIAWEREKKKWLKNSLNTWYEMLQYYM